MEALDKTLPSEFRRRRFMTCVVRVCEREREVKRGVHPSQIPRGANVCPLLEFRGVGFVEESYREPYD